MRWLLDTNVISESVRLRPNSRVSKWMADVAPQDLAISILSIAELRDGIATARDERRRAALKQWFDAEILPRFGNQILPATEDVLTDWLGVSRRLRKTGRPRDPADMLLASTARVHNLTLATRNVKHFADTGIVVYDPWNGETHRMKEP